MGRSIAISIGVAKVTNADAYFPVLHAAPRDAEAFAAWAERQGFEATTFTDAQGPVRLEDVVRPIAAAIKDAEAGLVKRLFVYFAGHGLDNGTGQDCWLLSDAVSDNVPPSQAVNLTLSKQNAWQSWIRHVVFISDACRTQSNRWRITGSPLIGLPTEPSKVTVQGREIDVFYATRPGADAQEIPPGDDPETHGYGLYTRYLMEALYGQAPNAIIDTPGGESERAVTSHELRDDLYERLPWADEEPCLIQRPEAEPSSKWKPHVIAWIDDGQEAATRLSQEAEHSKFATPHQRRAAIPDPDGEEQFNPEPEEPALLAEVAANRQSSAIARRQFFAHADTASPRAQKMGPENGAHAGVTVLGAQIGKVLLKNERVAPYIFSEDRTHGLGRNERAGPALLLLKQSGETDPTWAATTILPNRLTQIRVGPNGVEHVAYLSLEDHNDPEVVAWATARARWGSPFSEHPRVKAALWEGFDPTLAVLFAHSMSSLGKIKEVQRLLQHLQINAQPIPFDVALIARNQMPYAKEVVPGYPLTARGWHILSQVKYGGVLSKLALPHLAPAFWTTLIDPSPTLLRFLLTSDG
ncbi:caspase family protein [Streptomyces sp. NPDC051364]|uniref:caspase family protein n=1 Tax=Streptomyces sp. NPDC051364 TaxID=3155799 RepID=UPI0034480E39